MAIVKHDKTANFSILANQVFEDPRISFKAKGVLGLLLTKPNGWEVMTQHLVNSGPDGRVAVLSALRELEDVGYIVRERQRGEDGAFDNATTVVYEEPTSGYVPKGTKPQVTPQVGFPPAVNPPAVNPPVGNRPLVKTELSITEEGSTEAIERGGASAARSRSTVIPDTFTLTGEMRRWVSDERLSITDLHAVTAKFTDYYRGTGQKRADWIAAWQLWVRREVEYEKQAESRPLTAAQQHQKGMDFLMGQVLSDREPLPSYDYDAECVGEDILTSEAVS